MHNLNKLLENMRAEEWHVTAFRFKFKDKEYIVLVEDLKNIGKDGLYQIRLTFIDIKDINRLLVVDANANRFNIGVKELKDFLGVEGFVNMRDFFWHFYQYFDSCVPEKCVKEYDDVLKKEVINCLNKHDNDNATCCFSIRRNGKYNGAQHYRSIFNSNKTEILRKSLYEKFKKDKTVSFCYRERNEVDDLTILSQFEESERRRILNRA